MQDPIVSISTIRNFMGNAGRNTCNEYLYQALLDADEALQRRIAKDVIKNNSTSTKTYLCPVCKRTVIKGNNYCGNCGQQLNTSKIERKKQMKLKFEGYSDDTFGEYGVTGEDVDNCGSMDPIQCVVDAGIHGKLMVIGQYSKASCSNGCWMIGISKVEEEDVLPDWKISLLQGDMEYSPALELEIQDEVEVTLTWYKNGRKEEFSHE